MLSTCQTQTTDPFSFFRDFDRALHRLWDDAPGSNHGHGKAAFAVDVSEADDTLVVEAELPGYRKSQISVNVERGVLTIEADRSIKDDAETKEETSGDTNAVRRHLTERVTKVNRRFALPTAYDTTRVEAQLTDGVLTLRLPKRDEVKPRSIEVK